MLSLEQLYTEIAGGDAKAFEFITLWQQHGHSVDDIIDNDIRDSEDILRAFVAAQELVLHPFFQKHKDKLYPLHILAAIDYADSCKMSGDKEAWRRNLGDFLRSAGNNMLIIIAGICTPADENVWSRLRRLSLLIREISYRAHHTDKDEPI